MNPVCTSYITDLWPSNGRSAALGVFYWGIYFGYSFTFLVGTYGTEANILGLGWRFAYIIIGIPGILASGEQHITFETIIMIPSSHLILSCHIIITSMKIDVTCYIITSNHDMVMLSEKLLTISALTHQNLSNYSILDRGIFFLAIFIGVVILFIRDRSYELRKKAEKKAASETDDEINKVTQSKPLHWTRTLTKSQLKDIGRAFVQPSLLIVIVSAVFRQTGLYFFLYAKPLKSVDCTCSPPAWMQLEVRERQMS